ncbi:hypothetical protein ACHAXA_004815 [Cyclostephanos tholiformis]|uniref:Uncharacterized protein n=1 Tax=Cyclostephanos tholiformis TaxID=382380 RepID=A0ABD3RWQ8_9STRA
MFEREKIEIRTLRSHLLDRVSSTPLPPDGILLSVNSIAIRAALSGLDAELKKLEREERLVRRFSRASANAMMTDVDDAAEDPSSRRAAGMVGVVGTADAADGGGGINPPPLDDAEYVQMTREDALVASTTASIAMRCDGHDAAMTTCDDDDWEDADDDPPPSTSGGRRDDEGVGGGEMDDTTEGSGSVYLVLRSSLDDDDGGGWVYVTFGTMSQISNSRDGSSHEETTTSGGDKGKKDKERKSSIMTFPLGRHVNLEGFRAAKAKAGGGVVNNSTSSVVPPSLFYVALPDLLRRFVDEFFDGTALSSSTPPRQTNPNSCGRAVVPTTSETTAHTRFMDPVLRGIPGGEDRLVVGDFEDDLLPSGLPRPGGSLMVPPRGGRGSQMGPDHPIFDRTFGDYYDENDLGRGGGGIDDFTVPGLGSIHTVHPAAQRSREEGVVFSPAAAAAGAAAGWDGADVG